MITKKQTYYSHGKLLLTGEYVVLDGAKALATPTKYGQSLTVEAQDKPLLHWQSKDHKGVIWFEASFTWDGIGFSTDQKTAIGDRLVQIFNAVQGLNSSFFEFVKGTKVISTLEFPNEWGLGSSSTLIANIAKWAQVDAYKLLEQTFGGSGYDIACAQHDNALLYQLEPPIIHIEPVFFRPLFFEQLFFVHLNKKQDSRESIAHYRATPKVKLQNCIQQISGISELLWAVGSVAEFEALIQQHETLISTVIKTPTIKEQLFSDYPHAIKSLGGWGGDFILATGDVMAQHYFRKKGYPTIVPFRDMIT